MQQSLLTVETLLYALLAAQALTLGLLAWLFLRTRRVAERLPDDPNEQIDKLQATTASTLRESAEETEEALGETMRAALRETEESVREAQAEARRQTVGALEAARNEAQENIGEALRTEREATVKQVESELHDATSAFVREVTEAVREHQGEMRDSLVNELGKALQSVREALRESQESTRDQIVETLQDSLGVAVREINAAQQQQQQAFEERFMNKMEDLLRDLLDTNDHERAARAWLDAAAGEDDDAALRRIEAAFAQYPASRSLFKKLNEHLRPLLAAGNDVAVRREAALQLDEHTQRFAEHCALDDFDFARQKQDEMDEWMAAIRKAQRAEHRDELAGRVQALQQKVTDLARNPATTDERTVRELERMDRTIDSKELSEYEDLRETYDQVSQQLVEHFRRADRRKRSDARRRYNRDALEAIKEAWRTVAGEQESSWNPFSQEAVQVDDADRLREVASRLGGWETQHLTPAVSKYLSAVYAEIFQQLDPENQIEMTERMVEEPAKDWNAYQRENADAEGAEAS